MTDLDAAVAAARRDYAAARPLSEEWARRASGVMPGGNTRSVLHFEPFPFRVERAEGKHLYDVDGHRCVDLLGNYTAGLLGHSPGPVLKAARAALDDGWSLGSVNADEVRLAELIVDRFPAIDQVRFTNSGTEANLMGLALAIHHTGRRSVIVFDGAYHGGVLTFGDHGREVNVPHDWVVATYNDLASVESAFASRPDGVACVLVEPMQGAGGCIPGAPEFLAGLRRLCYEHGALLVFDEVMTSRLSPGGAQRLLDISPDITTLGKYLGGGLTFGAFGGRRDLMAAFDPATGGRLGHAGTFNNNVASMAAGVAALAEVLTDEVLSATNARGDRLRDRLGETFAARGLPMWATGRGSLMNIHARDERLRELLFFRALEAGYYFARRGFIALSIEITDADVDGFVAVVDGWAELTRQPSE